uniref:Uncharacterized protein n=1 Tax=Cyprinodon variegatus TaxID=28743 RepID=A0A3Q2GIQ3_CYPVA
ICSVKDPMCFKGAIMSKRHQEDQDSSPVKLITLQGCSPSARTGWLFRMEGEIDGAKHRNILCSAGPLVEAS